MTSRDKYGCTVQDVGLDEVDGIVQYLESRGFYVW